MSFCLSFIHSVCSEILINKPEDIEPHHLIAEKNNSYAIAEKLILILLITSISRKSEISRERKKYPKISMYLFFQRYYHKVFIVCWLFSFMIDRSEESLPKEHINNLNSTHNGCRYPAKFTLAVTLLGSRIPSPKQINQMCNRELTKNKKYQ